MKVVVLTGGVGGSKLVLGMTRVLPAADITAVVNTGDDFRHLGLWISPDIDTLLYTLSGQANSAQGWGREAETWSFMAAVGTLGGPDWFRLGDGDLAVHVLRTMRLAGGETLTEITADFAARWGITATILPMSDQPVATYLLTDEGELPFQHYFVERRCVPITRSITYRGSADAVPASGVMTAISTADVILIAPSNPFLSVDPILAVPTIRDGLMRARAPVVAVSPIVAGRAVRGPTDKLMRELGLKPTPAAIATHFAGLIDGLLVDDRDRVAALPVAFASCDTMMITNEDRERVATAALALADRLR